MPNSPKVNDNSHETRRRESVEKILSAALRVFVDRGFAGGSMSQIAKQALVPQALIYHYFKSKEELWKAVKKEAFYNAQMPTDFGATKASNLRELIQIALKNRFDFYQNNPSLWRLIQWESLEGETTTILGVAENFEGPWAKELKVLQDKGKIKKDVEVKLVGILMRSAFFGLFDDMPKLYSRSELLKKQQQYIDLVSDTLASALS